MLGPRGSGAWVVALALLLVPSSAAADAPEIAPLPDPDVSIAPYAVHAVATNGYRTALGGAFDWVRPRAHGGGVVSATSGALLRAPHGLPERVDAVEPDGVGGWYVGGLGRVVHVLPSGEVDGGFAVALVDGEREGQTRALARSPDGRTLWVGGWFGTVNGTPRQGIAAVDADTGALREWRSAVPVEVWDVAVDPSGGTVYVSGRVVVQPEAVTVAALDAASGAVRATGPRGSGRTWRSRPAAGRCT